MRTQNKVAELFLHTRNGTIYSSAGGPDTKSDTVSPAELLTYDWVKQAKVVKLLGTTENAALIMALHNYRLQHGLPTIKVGSPSLCRGTVGRAVLREMQQLEYAPSVGGWHTLTAKDYCAYALTYATHCAAGKYTDEMNMRLKAHPAWGPLSFIPTLNKYWACHLLTEWRDPRFHVSTDEPDDMKLLNRFLGLGRRDGVGHIEQVLLDDGDAREPVMAWRARTVLKTWSQGWASMHAQDEISPRDFLMRVVQRVAASKDIPVALVRASYVFLRYLRLTWLDELAGEGDVFKAQGRSLGKAKETQVVRTLQARKNYSPTLFIPEYFFAHKDEAIAWRAHKFGGRKGN